MVKNASKSVPNAILPKYYFKNNHRSGSVNVLFLLLPEVPFSSNKAEGVRLVVPDKRRIKRRQTEKPSADYRFHPVSRRM